VPGPALAGALSVAESARLVRSYRYATERMLRALGGWIALTPELSAKLLMGRHVWDVAQQADAFGRRLPELRARGDECGPASPAVAAFMDALESPEGPEETVERLVGVYRVLKPHLLATYHAHLARANPVYEPPTRRILERCLDEERRHIAAGETVLRHLASTDERRARAARWQARLEAALGEAGGVTGGGCAPAPLSDTPPARCPEAEELIRLEGMGSPWPVPDDLDAALRSLGDALVAGDRGQIQAWVPPAPGLPDAVLTLPGGVRFARWGLVAFARIGAHRAAKLRLDGAGTAATLLARWVPGPAGWRLAALEVLRVDPCPPA
jgi:hypothetical protein